MASSTTTSSAPIASIMHRGDWTMGVLDRYFKFGDAGDQYCGRMLAGFDVHSSSFRQLPAHFKTLDATSSAVVSDAVSAVFGRGENSLPVRHPSVKPVLGRYLAALVHHYDWLVATLGPDHVIFTMVALHRDVDLLDRLRPLVTISPCEDGMKPTGIPPHVDTIVRLENMLAMQQKTLDRLCELTETVKTTIVTTICSCLEDRADEAGQITVQSMRAALAAQQCSTEQAISKSIQSEMAQLRAVIQGEPRRVGAGPLTEVQHVRNGGQRTFSYDGKMWCLPKNYEVPTNTVPRATGWDLWMRGDKAKGIGPFRSLSHKTMSKLQKLRYQVMKGFYSFCEEGLSTAVPPVDERGAGYMEKSEKEVAAFLKLRASYLWQAPTGRKKKKRDLAS